MRELLADDGLLFIDIVDFRAAYLRNWSVEDAIKIDHPYYLTEPTMTAYLSARDSTCCGVTTRRTICTSATSAVPAPRTAMPLPTASSVDELFREIRFVQNALKAQGPRLKPKGLSSMALSHEP